MDIGQPESPHLSSAFLPSVISVTRPLDYEQVPNGMIYLTVMAKDGGNPALNSTVPVTVEVIVSTTPKKVGGVLNTAVTLTLLNANCQPHIDGYSLAALTR